MERTSSSTPSRSLLAVAIRVAVAALLAAVAGSGVARAGGIYLYETGTPDMFTAAAGMAARAQDAGTVFANPAGMARLQKPDLLVGGGVLSGDIEFTSNSNTTVSGNDGGSAVGLLPNGGLYYARGLSPNWWFGIAATSNFGLASEYDEGWVGRYYVEKSTLIGASFVPSVAYRLSPKLSFGASLNVMYGILKNDVAINNVLFSAPDGRMSMNATDLGFGGNAGLLWEPSKEMRLGLTYTSPVQLDFEDKPEFTNLAPGTSLALDNAGLLTNSLGISMKAPQTLMASFYSDLNEKWALLGSAGWQDWSAFGGVNLGVATDPPTTLSTQLPYKDSYHGSLGAKRTLGGGWRLSGGIGYDSPMVEDSDRSVTMPVGESWRYAIGAQKKVNEKFDFGFGYSHIVSGNLTVDQNRGPLAGRVAGTYENAAIHILSLQGHWTF